MLATTPRTVLASGTDRARRHGWVESLGGANLKALGTGDVRIGSLVLSSLPSLFRGAKGETLEEPVRNVLSALFFAVYLFYCFPLSLSLSFFSRSRLLGRVRS